MPSPFYRSLPLLAAAFLSLAALSCSLDYGSALSDGEDESLPDSVLFGFEHTVVEDGAPRFRIVAEEAASYQKASVIRLRAVSFQEFDAVGKVVAEGEAASAVFYPGTESAELTGSVRFYRDADGVTVESAFLRWDGEARTLSSRSDALTSIADDDGASLEGAGFAADAARRTFSFEKGMSGIYAGGIYAGGSSTDGAADGSQDGYGE